jgi:hypothetical protein
MGKSPWRKHSSANQNTPTINTLITAAKARKYKVDSGYFLIESDSDGPVFILTGIDNVKAWFKSNGNPCFELLA